MEDQKQTLILEAKTRQVWVGGFASRESDANLYFKKNIPVAPDQNRKSLNIVILHDFYDYHQRYLELGDYLYENLDENIYLHWPDFEGHGQSSGTRGHTNKFDHYCFDTLHYLELLRKENEAPTLIIGQGMGGLVILKMLDHIMTSEQEKSLKLKGLVYVNPLINFNYNLPQFKFSLLDDFLPSLSRLKLPIEISAHQLCSDPVKATEMQADGLINTKISWGLLSEILEAAKSVRRSSYFLHHPSLFLVSQEDFLTDTKKIYLFQKGLPHELSTFLSFEKAKHDLLNDTKRVIVFNSIVKWIKKLKD